MTRIRKLLLLLLLLAYTGQSLAAVALPCSMTAAAGADMSAMDHAGHHMAADSPAAPVTATDDCCDGGLCVMSHCQAAAALPLHETSGIVQYAALYPPSHEARSPLHSIDFLYRPPISR